MICITDEAEAAARDELLLSLAADPSTPPSELPAPVLGPGIRDERPDGVEVAAGTLFPQREVSIGGQARMLDDVVGGGFVLYILGESTAGFLDAAAADYLDALGGSVMAISAEMDGGGDYRSWFQRNGCLTVLVRPDFYVFGSARSGAEACAMVGRLRAALEEDQTPTRE